MQCGLSSLIDRKDPLSVTVNTKYTPNQDFNKEMELQVNIKQPFDRWNKDAIDINISTKKDYIKTTITDKRFSEVSTYNLEGITEYDVVKKMVDSAYDRFGKPDTVTNEI